MNTLYFEKNRHCENNFIFKTRKLRPILILANVIYQELKLALNGSEGRVEALESQLARLEGHRRDLEYKLASIHSSLRRSIGFRQDNYVDGRSLRPRSTSPRRRPQSPSKGKNDD